MSNYGITKLKRSHASGGRGEYVYNALWFNGKHAGGSVIGKTRTRNEAQKIISKHKASLDVDKQED